jgi:hypothetical protein
VFWPCGSFLFTLFEMDDPTGEVGAPDARAEALEEAVYDAQDAMFDGDLAGALDGARAGLEAAGIAWGEPAEKKGQALPARSPLARAARDAFEVMAGIYLQRCEWASAMGVAEAWATACGTVEVRPFSLGLRAAYCGFCGLGPPSGGTDGRDTGAFVQGSVRLTSTLFDEAHQHSLAGGREQLASGQLLLEQAQALAQFADITASEGTDEFRRGVETYDDLLQQKMASEDGGMDALEPHEQGRVAALVAWARCRTTAESRQRADALEALDMIAEGCVMDAVTSAEAARGARALRQEEAAAVASSGKDEAQPEDEEGEEAALAAQLGLLDANDGGDEGVEMAPTFSLATEYIPSPLDLGLGLFYALIAIGGMESGAAAHRAAVFRALGDAFRHGLGDDENVQGACVLAHGHYAAGLPSAGAGDQLAPVVDLLRTFASDGAALAGARVSAARASNVLIQQRLKLS